MVRFADSLSAPAYRPAIRTALQALRRDDGCPHFATDGGVLDWVDIDALAKKSIRFTNATRTSNGV